MSLFTLIGRYFWLLCLGITACNYVVGVRSLASRSPNDPSAGADALSLRRWFAISSAVPWIVMGWGVIIGGVPNIWYYFRPQDHNLFVLTWFLTIFVMSVYFAYWVFFQDGAEKVVSLKPFEVNWPRASFRGAARGTFLLTTGRVKFFAAIGPLWFAAWIYLVSSTNAPIPK